MNFQLINTSFILIPIKYVYEVDLCEKIAGSFYQQNFYEHYHFSHQLDCTSTEADSSDGSEDCIGYAPQITKYKTQPCKNYSLSGHCSYGDRCQFAHGNYEMKPVHFGGLYETRKCKNFWKKGFCLYGIRCQFLHSECEKRQSQYNKKEYGENKKSGYLELRLQSRLLEILE